MRIFLFLLLALSLYACSAPPARAEVNVYPLQLQQGFYRLPNCTLCDSANACRSFNRCGCKGEVVAAQTGDAALDTLLREAAQAHQCAGTLADPANKSTPSMRKVSYEVTRNDDHWLSVVYEYYQYNAGTAHGMTTYEALVYDKQKQQWMRQSELIVPAKREAAALAVLSALLQKNQREGGGLWLNKLNPATLFGYNGCDGCIVYPDMGGKWTVRFQLYTIAPYVKGAPTVSVPSHFFE